LRLIFSLGAHDDGAGGTAISGFPPRGRHPINLESNKPSGYVGLQQLGRQAVVLHEKYLVLRQDPKNAEPQKLDSLTPTRGVPIF